MASVTPRKNRDGTITWRVQFRIDSRLVQESFPDQRPAEQFGDLVDRVGGKAARQVLETRRGNHRATPTLREWTATYLDPATGYLSGVTDATRAGYAQIAERSFLHLLGEIPVDAITKQAVARWVTWQESQPSKWRQGETVSAKTIRNYHGLLSSLLTAAHAAGIADSNPARGTRITRGVRHGITFLTEGEFQTVLHFIPDYYKPLTLFLASTGMRWGEATALTWGDITENTARVDKAWKKGPNGRPVLGPPKTRKSVRTVSLWPELVAALGPRGRADELVFVGVKDARRIWSERYRKAAWYPAVRSANDEALCASLGLTPIAKNPRVHDLRHTHASWLIGKGTPLPYVQARLGHENITTTVDTYGHLLPEAHNVMAAVMEEVMGDLVGEVAASALPNNPQLSIAP